MSKKRVNSDYGMIEYYKYYKKNKINKEKTVSIAKYNKIVSEFNQSIISLVLRGAFEYKVPYLGMTLGVRKCKITPRIVDGKLRNTTPVDWKATNELWEKDAEAKEKKIVLKYSNYHTSKYIFRIVFVKYGKLYKNKQYYKFKAVRSFQRALAKRIFNENLETFDAYKLY